MLDRYPINSASSIAQAIELITANIDNPTELNAIGTAVEDLRLVHEDVAGSDRATWYRLDTSSDAVVAPYIMASATAGLRWVAIGGYATNQAMRIASTLAVGAGLTASSNVSVGGSLAVTSTATLSGLTTVIDGNFTIIGSVDSTKKLAFEVDAQTTGKKLTIDTGAQTVDRTLTVPVLAGNDTIAALAVAQVFSGANRFSNATTASSSITGALVVGDGVTAGTNVGIGGGNINAGGTLTVAGIGSIGGATTSGAVLAIGNGSTLSGVNQVGIFTPGSLIGTSAATGSLRGMQYNLQTAAAAFTCAEVTTIVCGAFSAGAGSTITRGYGLRIAAGGAAATANVGLSYGSSLTETGTWFIYDSSSHPSRFGASVLLGTTTDGMTAGGSIAIAQDFAHRGTKFGAFNATPTTQSTGYGTPTGGAKLINFPGATATLAQTSGALAQLLLDLKAYGLLGA